MADKQSGPNLFANWPLLAAILALGTYFVSHPEAPIQGSRPSTSDHPAPGVEQFQDVDARLWQDPFAAMWRDIATMPDGVPDPECKGNPIPEAPHSCPPTGPLQILGVMLPGSPYPEAQEFRRQVRYAVVSSLGAKNYGPEDEEHIGYFRVKLNEKPQTESAGTEVYQEAGPGEIKRKPDWGSAWLDTAFEEFRSPTNQPLLVLWINEEQLAKATNGCNRYGLSTLEQKLLPSDDLQKPRIAFLGPWGSTTLRSMVSEGDRKPCLVLPLKSGAAYVPLTIYNFSATAEEDLLEPIKENKKTLSEYFGYRNLTYARTIATDLDVAHVIAEELAKWGINPGKDSRDHVVLISEWDSFYGQNFPRSMEKAFDRLDCTDQTLALLAPGGERLHCFSYLRGLDGQLPDVRASSAKPPAPDGQNDTAPGTPSGNSQSLAPPDLSRNIERPEGNGQYDYVRRLRSKISDLNRQLRKDGTGQIRAIGVVGSDVYDKLAVLQLLRPAFPEAAFFTTDLDARLYHPKEINSTRNLIVGSTYGLELRNDLQGRIPPFRSAYQTSAFLATRLALEDASKPKDLRAARLDWAHHPRLFQIGMTGPFAFRPSTGPDADQSGAAGSPEPAFNFIISLAEGLWSSVVPAKAAPKSDDAKPPPAIDDCQSDLRTCETSIIPLLPDFFPSLPAPLIQPGAFLAWATGVSTVMLGLGLFLSWRIRACFTGRMPFRTEPDGTEDPSRLNHPLLVVTMFYVVGFLVCLAWPWLAIHLTANRNGEPMLLLAGISLWPLIVMRIFIILCALAFTVHGFRRLDANLLEVAKAFHPLPEPRAKAQGFREGVRRVAEGVREDVLLLFQGGELRNMFSFQLGKPGPREKPLDHFWNSYLQKVRPAARCFRAGAAMFAVILLYLILGAIFGSPEPIARQSSLRGLYWILLWGEALTTWFLIFVVADATLLCVLFVNELLRFPSDWSTETVEPYPAELNLESTHLDRDCLIDLHFIAKRTGCIDALAIYSFFVLALIILSQSSLFGIYPANWPAFITTAVGLLIVFGCVWLLSSAAEGARRWALMNVNGRNAGTSGSPKPTPEQTKLVRWIEDFQEGAFMPFPKQPIVRALLLPAGGLGGTALLSYLPAFLGP